MFPLFSVAMKIKNHVTIGQCDVTQLFDRFYSERESDIFNE